DVQRRLVGHVLGPERKVGVQVSAQPRVAALLEEQGHLLAGRHTAPLARRARGSPGRGSLCFEFPERDAPGHHRPPPRDPPRPARLATCAIEHASGNVIDFPMIQDLAALLWVVNLGCIDLNQWYARCDDVDRPDYLHFDLDPTEGATFAQVLETARILHTTLDHLGMPSYPKTTGSRGVHVYVPIVRGPTQKEVWTVARTISLELARHHPKLITAEYSMARRPRGRVLVDYNQNAWGRTLASVYSVRPTPRAAVSTPVTWAEVERGLAIDDFRLDNVPARVKRRGDLWAP